MKIIFEIKDKTRRKIHLSKERWSLLKNGVRQEKWILELFQSIKNSQPIGKEK